MHLRHALDHENKPGGPFFGGMTETAALTRYARAACPKLTGTCPRFLPGAGIQRNPPSYEREGQRRVVAGDPAHPS